jgi:hypothetical protein
MRRLYWAALVLMAPLVLIPGCASAEAADSPTLRLRLEDRGRLRVVARGPGEEATAEISVEGGSSFTIELSACSLRSATRPPQGKRFELVMDLHCRKPIHFDIGDISGLVVTRDGKKAAAVADYPAGKHKIVVTGQRR